MRQMTTTAVTLFGVAMFGAAAAWSLEPPRIAMVPAGDERIVFPAEEFKGTAPRRVRFTDFWEWEEYAQFQGGGARAEIIYSAAKTDQAPIALEYNLTLRRMVETWNLNRSQIRDWGGEYRLWTRLGLFFYRPYTLAKGNLNCVAFANELDFVSEDPMTRPSKVIFGYYCAEAGASLPADRIDDLIDRIGVRGITERLPRDHARDERGADRVASMYNAAATIARGASPSADTGNASFPFAFAVHYVDVDGDGNRGH